ncbi:ATP-binding protein [Streptomyces griseoluteus]|uniref:ATP-binding protein n=1 Tax=Streptomyces griseoluteus TaxID=29306 RepID=UPI00332B5E0D
MDHSTAAPPSKVSTHLAPAGGTALAAGQHMSATGRLSVRYPKTRASVGKARLFARLFADGIGADDLVDDLVLIVSELVTNAVLHGKTPPGRQVEVTLDHSAGRVRVEVRDTGEGVPRRRPSVPLVVAGRGLGIVNALSGKWGVTEQVVGKTVWAELAVDTAEAVDDR